MRSPKWPSTIPPTGGPRSPRRMSRVRRPCRSRRCRPGRRRVPEDQGGRGSVDEEVVVLDDCRGNTREPPYGADAREHSPGNRQAAARPGAQRNQLVRSWEDLRTGVEVMTCRGSHHRCADDSAKPLHHSPRSTWHAFDKNYLSTPSIVGMSSAARARTVSSSGVRGLSAHASAPRIRWRPPSVGTTTASTAPVRWELTGMSETPTPAATSAVSVVPSDVSCAISGVNPASWHQPARPDAESIPTPRGW